MHKRISCGSHWLRQRRSFASFEKHLRTNTIGPIIVAQKLLQTHISLGSVIFMSSDSGSAANFRAFEDGYLSRRDTLLGLRG